jgi:RNA polymerase sigma factor (sigma-70 family)
MTPVTASGDAELVNASLSGNREAFGQIVSRYQSLVCSLAYSATGSLSQSEDLAQETFFAAWKHLAELREPAKLRAWLCGIARNLINDSLRTQGREPSHRAESLDEISESHSPEPLPAERAISKEEAEILWRSLERIPEAYRVPLVLFYREHQSVQAVAQNLELTEEAARQRLSRGRRRSLTGISSHKRPGY